MRMLSTLLKGVGTLPALTLLSLVGSTTLMPSEAAAQAAASTKDQIEAGITVYTTRCQRCHSEKLAGGAGPALRGADFTAQWEGKTLRALYGRILMTMPYDDPGSLTPVQVLSLVSYIATENQFAQWTTPFSSANQLTTMTIGRPK